MSKILTQIAKVSNKIETSPNCGYLYQYFDELVALLEPLKSETLPPVVIRMRVQISLMERAICQANSSFSREQGPSR